MALKIKVKTFNLPTSENTDTIEEEIEDEIKSKLNNGYTLEQMVGDAALVLLIFKKEE